jgi:hypothetical protein
MVKFKTLFLKLELSIDPVSYTQVKGDLFLNVKNFPVYWNKKPIQTAKYPLLLNK